ncbi:Nucleoporin NUP49 [Golovinomyces cichoracearum]|uniref:Nucleoporin NUP49 n=1 Tax=Golovinomyces cichoracearum TaxID=62708 RepID=A0A420JAM7_9PEZI|nr:Nucleoporin NUP49 [Golovinomyces cichoracearum]
MFGQPATATSGNLFGQPAAAATTTSTGGLFGQPAAATTTTSTGSLFSQPATATPTTGNLFGQPAAATTTTSTGGLFGQPTAATTTTSTGSLFGQPAAATNTSTGNLFGQPASTGNGSVFGQTNQTQNIFGNIGGQNKQTQSQQADTNAGLFGKNSTGGLSLGQNSTQQQQTIPGVLIDTSNIRGTTRFNDLKEELQKQLMEIDTMIQAQIQLKNDCDAIMPAHESQLTQIPIDVEFCQRKLVGVDNAADSDIHAISAVQKLIKNDAEAAKLSFAAIDILKLPPQYHLAGVWSPKNNNRGGSGETEGIVGLFSQTADELSAKLATYQKHISEIEQHLRGVEANSAHQINNLAAKKNGNTFTEESSFDQLAGVLRDFETGLLNIAGKVGETRKGVTALQLNQFFPASSNNRI